MTLTVCFDVLHTCFSLEPLERALDKALGPELKQHDSGARMVVMDWFHCAQRDFAMLTTVNHPDPPPPIAQILKLTLHRSVHFALYGSSPTNTSLTSTSTAASAPSSSEAADAGAAAATAYSAKLQPVIDALTQLTPSPSLEPAWKTLTAAGAKVILVTNGAEAATRKYATMGGVDGYISEIISCDAVGKGKPDKKVYDAAHRAADRIGAGEGKEGRWFVACHTWDVAAARKNGFLTGLVLSEQPPLDEENQKAFWGLYGGKPDVVGRDLAEVAQQIVNLRTHS